MRILVINPILYTSETRRIRREASIQDTMIYDFCLAFGKLGHEVTLLGGEPFRPREEEDYPFPVLWGKCVGQGLFMPHCLPFMPATYALVKNGKYDLVISSEVFSLNSLLAYWAAPQKTVIWHELAKHNAILHRIPSKLWYNVVARFLMRRAKVVARSVQARAFIGRYCKNTQHTVIGHGVNLDKFQAVMGKENYFVVCSQLIARKRIDGILKNFAAYVQTYDATASLWVIGEGELAEDLKKLAAALQIAGRVVFAGKMRHGDLLPVLARAKALLVNTEKDNNMVSIAESVAVATPVVTTDVPLNADTIRKYGLGIVKKAWTQEDLKKIVLDNTVYVQNCMNYRENLSTKTTAKQFLAIMQKGDG